VRQRGPRSRVDDRAAVAPLAGHEDHARPVAGADEGVLRAGRAVDEIPGPQLALLHLDHEQAGARYVNAYNADVASPVAVQEFWAKHGELPRFAGHLTPRPGSRNRDQRLQRRQVTAAA
jgi:hypothetical protein